MKLPKMGDWILGFIAKKNCLDSAMYKYTANVLTIKTTGTGNCGVPAGKICTIYGKGL